MKIKIPFPIQLNEKEQISFTNFVLDNLLNDNQFGKDFQSIELALEIQTKLTNAQPEQIIELSPASFQLLKFVCEHPSYGYQAKLARALFPFMKAIVYPEMS